MTLPLRSALAALGALALSTGLAAVPGSPASAAAPAATADTAADTAEPRRVVSLFPSDDLTVRDLRQHTGRRVSIPTTGCTTPSVCGLAQRINELDGFDLDPRLALRFDGPVDPVGVARATRVERVGGGQSYGVDRVVYDRATNTVYAHPRRQLDPGTTYRLRVRGGTPARTRFTTLSARDGLRDLREQIVRGVPGVPPRGVRVDAVVPAAGTTLSYVQDRGTGGRVPAPVPNVSATGAGSYVFGSYLAPSWLRADRTIAQPPTGTRGPRPVGVARLPFVMILPAGQAPAGGWPVSLFGHGFTRSNADVFLAASQNASAGLATVATHVVGHGFGPRSTWRVTRAGATRSLPAYGRGVDLDRDGVIGSTEGSGTLAGSPAAAVGSRDGLRQTTADLMTLVRVLGRTGDVTADGRRDVRAGAATYYGQSFGGIYGSLLAGIDHRGIARAVLNVPGGPVTEIARLSPAFRPLTTQALQNAGLLNSRDAARGSFVESLPLRGQGPVLDPAPGALAIQDFLADTTWLTRPGSPETFAPRLRPDRTIVQVAYADQTVPNPTSYTLIDAGRLQGRTTLLRNDLRATPAPNPHGFLLTPDEVGRLGQQQVVAFLRTGRTIDPDGAAPVFEVPVRDPRVLLRLNFTNPAFPG